jgi:hypothetical protein
MKTLFICALVFSFLLMGRLSLSSSESDERNDVISGITSADGQERQKSYVDAKGQYDAEVKNLLAIVNAPLEKNENFCDFGTPRNLAIKLLGEMRAMEAVEPLLEWIAPHEGQICAFTRDIGEPFAVTALIKIGKPASVECLKRLALEDNDKEIAFGSKRGLMLRVIRKVEGDDVAHFMLQNAIDKEQDKDRKANLTAALELLDKWIKAEADRAKQHENPPAPPAEGGATPPASEAPAPPPDSGKP